MWKKGEICIHFYFRGLECTSKLKNIKVPHNQTGIIINLLSSIVLAVGRNPMKGGCLGVYKSMG